MNRFFDRLSIGRKLTLAIMLTSAASLLCAFLTFAFYEVWNQRTTTLQRLASLAETTAYNSASALLFNDAQSAQYTLDALRGNRQVVSATVLDRNRRPFVQYKAPLGVPTRLPSGHEGFWADEVSIERPIESDDTTIGYLSIHANLGDMWKDMALGALITLFILLLALLIAYLLGRRLQRILSDPILSLAQTAQRISRDKDYSQRAVKRSDDEIGALVDSFNEMLGQIQTRDARLADHTEELERIVAERTANLARLRDEAISANQAKSDFLANMSHEIRTPMNAVIGMSTLMARTPLSDKQKEYLDGIRTSAGNLLGIINDILDFSKIEAKKLDFENTAFDLDAVLTNLSHLFTDRADEKGIEFILDCPHSVPRNLVGDALRLGQVLSNLTGNALKFTENGEIVVSIRLIAGRPDSVSLRFSVSDTGIGLSEEHAAKLFQPFSQADASTTRKFGGTGLGLAISKQLVELMGGAIGVTSTLGRGSQFFFTARFGRGLKQDSCRSDSLLGECLQPRECHAHRQKRHLQHHRVLVVDDSITAREILCVMLSDFDLKVRTCASAEAAIAELERAATATPDDFYDLVLMDWKMPGIDGIEAVRRIRANSRLPRVPTLIMVTAFAQEDLLRHINRRELDGVLLKPFSSSHLCATLVRALGGDAGDKGAAELDIDTSGEAAVIQLCGRVLLVDDTLINQVVAREMLEFAGLDIVLARNGQEAVELALAEPFDLVLMDIEMPVMDGYEATRLIRQHERLKDLPIVAMTAHAMSGVRERCVAAGMNGHIAKPIDMPGLHGMLRQWLPAREQSSAPNAVAVKSPAHTDFDRYSGMLPDIDAHAALERLGQKHALYRQLLQTFLDEHRETGPRIEAALATGDFEAAGKILHTLKGVSGNLGMTRLHRTAVVLEDALARNTWQPDQLGAFRDAFADVVSSLSGLIPDDTAAGDDSIDEPSGRPDAHALPPLLTALAGHLREGSPRAADLLPELKAALGGSIPELMHALIDQINAFDFETAENTLEQLVQRLNPHLHLVADESPP